MTLTAHPADVACTGPAVGQPDSAETSFYARYDWCLNPLLTLDAQRRRFSEELEYGATRPGGWQRDECAVNVYLLACSITCTVDDYLARRAWDLVLIAERLPRLRVALPVLRWLLNLPSTVRNRVVDRPIYRWRKRWAQCVDSACELLVGAGSGDAERWRELQSTSEPLRHVPLPRSLGRRRLRIPEGFRAQDLSHHDVLALARRYAERPSPRPGSVVVLGVRTAGAYFAPLVKAYLVTRGWAGVRWFTLRPRRGLSGPEQRQLRRLAREGTEFVVIDDHPNTGSTLTLLLEALTRCDARPDQITILTPRHPVQPDWVLPRDAPGADRIPVITLEPEETHKAQLLTPTLVAPLLREWFGAQGWQRIVVGTSSRVAAVNARLAEHGRAGFQARLQRVFEVRLARDNAAPIVVHVVAKSVGWGWLGYHAYLAGTRLDGFVPPVLGLRHGLLFSQWVGDVVDRPTAPREDVSAAPLAAYLARRTQCLRLSEDPHLEDGDSAWGGWHLLLQLLRRGYGPYVGRLRTTALWRELRRFKTPHPTLVDGRMRPSEWVHTPHGSYKLDYEHHNFGPAHLDLVDPAYDLASAIFEFRLTDQAEAALLHGYARETGDATLSGRVLLFKLLTGIVAMREAAGQAPRPGSEARRAQWNERYLTARSFLAYEMHRLSAGLMPRHGDATWSGPLFFLDVDGVFDCERLGFPHTTASGLAALALLKAQGFAVVLNTGRSVEHVRRYCQLYGLAGGVAEYGCVFVDAAAGRELLLTPPAAGELLQQCREAVSGLPGVFVDPTYRYAVRAYRYEGGRTVGLRPSELAHLGSRPESRDLTYIAKRADTYIVPRGTTKGTAVLAVKQALGRSEPFVAAMGDSNEDVSMLEAAAAWYAPANCSAGVRELARRTGGRIMALPNQRGLLAAARELGRRGGMPRAPAVPRPPARVATATDLVVTLLHAADRSRLRQVLAAFRRHRL